MKTQIKPTQSVIEVKEHETIVAETTYRNPSYRARRHSTHKLDEQKRRQAIAAWIRSELEQGDKSRFVRTLNPNLRAQLIKSELKFVDSEFTHLVTCKGVEVKMPAADQYTQLCSEHYCVIPSDSDLDANPEIIFVPQHWRRSLPCKNQEKVLRNFYTPDESLLGKIVVADVEIQIKTDLSTGKKNYVLNYSNIKLKEHLPTLQYLMKVGTTNRGQLPIFGTDQYILIKRLPAAVTEAQKN